MNLQSHSIKDKATRYIHWILLCGLVIISTYFIANSYYEIRALDYETANKLLIRNIILASLFIVVSSFLVRYFSKKEVDLIREIESVENKAAIKAKFLSTMSHEIRTPMNAVVGLSDILIHENPRPDQVENLQTLKFSANLLLSLINDILDYSKIEAGKINIENIDYDLKSVVNSIKNALNPKSREKNIALNLTLAPGIPDKVKGDPVRLSQILTNLIGNAIKFTTEGSVDINLEVLKKTEDLTTIRFSIKDTGIGIPKSKFAQIFKSFSQAEADTTRKFGGTGLGLSITKRLLELQNSEIKLISEQGKGSTFYFDLMLETINTAEETPHNQKTDFTTFEPFDQESILLVEDNKINVMVAEKFLKKWNLNIDVAENGAIALEMVQNKDYSLILMDLNMPVMDGYCATEAIRKLNHPRFQEIPIIALSASAIAGFRNKAIDAGMNAFVNKPFVPEELYQALYKYMRVPV